MGKIIWIVSFILTLSISFPTAQAAVIKASEIQVGDVKAVVPLVTEGGSKKILEAVNRELADRMTGYIQDFITNRKHLRNDPNLPEEIKKHASFAGSYTVYYNGGPWISIAEQGYSYTGGAHGMPFEETMTVNLNTGKVYGIGDLFQKGFNYKEYLTQRVQAEAKERQELVLLEEPQVTEEQSFYLTEQGLVIYYPPYAIAPYAAGFIRFTIPYVELEGRWVSEVADLAPGFTISGEEPFWRMNIQPGDSIHFEGLFEKEINEFMEYNPPLYTGNEWIYKLGSEMVIRVSKQPCYSTMTGEPFNYAATLKWQGKVYTGCVKRW